MICFLTSPHIFEKFQITKRIINSKKHKAFLIKDQNFQMAQTSVTYQQVHIIYTSKLTMPSTSKMKMSSLLTSPRLQQS